MNRQLGGSSYSTSLISSSEGDGLDDDDDANGLQVKEGIEGTDKIAEAA